MISTIGRRLASDNVGTVVEDLFARRDIFCRPILPCEDDPHGKAAVEHPVHIRQFARVEVREVKTSYGATVVEHIAHILHVLCHELSHVKIRQTGTLSKHRLHIPHIVRLHLVKSRDGLQVA